jgi:hypothetical protein
MKTKEVITVILAAAMMVGFFGILNKACENDRYTTEAVITKIEGCIITATDSAGNKWCYEVKGDTLPRVGTKVVLTMRANGTTTIYDDEVVGIE